MRQTTLHCSASFTVTAKEDTPHIDEEKLAILLLNNEVPQGYSLVEGPTLTDVTSCETQI